MYVGSYMEERGEDKKTKKDRFAGLSVFTAVQKCGICARSSDKTWSLNSDDHCCKTGRCHINMTVSLQNAIDPLKNVN